MPTSVDTLIADARTFAAGTYEEAVTNIGNATSVVESMARTVFTGLEMPNIGVITPFVPAAPPTLVAQEFITPERPGAPEAPTPIPDPLDGLGPAPALSASSPNINLGGIVKPTQLAQFVGVAPEINTDFEFPDAPELINPALPVLVDRTAPTKPDILLPRFEGVMPDDIASAPTDYAERFTAAYREAAPSMVSALDGHIDAMMAKYNPRYKEQMASIENKLADYLQGGTALTPEVENAIYERSKGKQSAEARRTRDEAYLGAARRGFTMPDGALFAAVMGARQSAADNNARAAVEIAVKQAELEQQNMQWAVKTSTDLRTTILSAAINYHQNLISLNGQALDYAKSILSSIIEVYNTMVKEYQARLEGYKTEASVYETEIKGQLAIIEVYKAEIDALQAMTQVDVAKIGAYREQINAMQAMVGMYRSRIEAVVSAASLEKLKLELFGQQVQAYAVQTQAKNSEWQGYAAAIGGEEAKARVYATQVQAYAAEWGGYKARVDAKSEQIKAVALSNQAKAAYAAAQVNAFSALVGAEGTRISAETQYQQRLIQGYIAANAAASAANQASTEAYKAKGQIATAYAGLSVNAMLQGTQLDITRVKAVADTAMAAGQVYAGLAQSALSGMNTLVIDSGNA